ncbi:DUF1003 domain-containing protein [Calothrix sp. UHCC 0171]|uniref:DUF1003 domain-containing protein n=1 Tax=Calothrix sp. UHCC 0171 TaxID=3110245 RepID=UPI002B210A0E|nr:DUF1003 domain-containing protein [Calothrix sp. UHCC 0171]MEA5571764.1 DUF1003 domain-containing protein [Calothrix sp. UHCC 0171]
MKKNTNQGNNFSNFNNSNISGDRLCANSEMEKLPENLLKNIEAVIGLQAQDEQKIPLHQRILEKMARGFGQPWFLYTQIIFFTSWGIFSHLANIGILAGEFPKLNLREQGIDIAALLISTGVLVHQTRQEKLEDKRSHLILQLNLLTEQKIAKLIALVEELRTDLPNVQNRYDREAEVMQQSTNPQIVLDILQHNLDQVNFENGQVEIEKIQTSHDSTSITREYT